MFIFAGVKRKIELLAPGGDVDSIKAAIAAGADAVYCGLDRFNARNRAANISPDDLPGIVRLAHQNRCEIFLTLNIIVLDNEIPALVGLLNKLVNTGIDGVIIQDIGMFYLLSNYFKGLKVHASTQLNTHNEGQIRFLNRLSASRVNLSRELNLQEIKSLTAIAHQNKVLTEVFVHGSFCLSFSGLCYLSSVHGGNSGNRGRCSQPCRDQYLTTPAGKDFPLNLKDNSAFLDLDGLADAGVDSLKIEGRIKKYHYVFSVVESWRKQLQRLYNQQSLSADNSELYRVFNRDFSNSYLKGDISRNMFIDHPRDHSAIYLAKMDDTSTDENLDQAKKDVYDDRTEIIQRVKAKIDRLSIEKVALTIHVSGTSGSPLKLVVIAPEKSWEVLSEINLENTGTEEITGDSLFKRLKAVNNTGYFIEELDLTKLQENVYLPFKVLTSMKKRLLFILNGDRENIDPVDVPAIKRQKNEKIHPSLLVLISSPEDISLCRSTAAQICFQIPNALASEKSAITELFRNNKELIPWFPAVMIGDDYAAALDFLEQVRPTQLVSDNTGIAFEAWQRGIEWIAGPSLNTVNSYSLQCLKEKFNCAGAFISNEISKIQLKQIRKPSGFKLYYSMYHPIELMTTRQCLFHQVSGCEKSRIDESCIQHCAKSASITNLKDITFRIEKSKGNYHRVYNESNFLNPEIVTDIPDAFSGFCVDLRNIKTGTTVECSKTEIVQLFENLLSGKAGSAEEIRNEIHPVTNNQYRKGIF